MSGHRLSPNGNKLLPALHAAHGARPPLASQPAPPSCSRTRASPSAGFACSSPAVIFSVPVDLTSVPRSATDLRATTVRVRAPAAPHDPPSTSVTHSSNVTDVARATPHGAAPHFPAPPRRIAAPCAARLLVSGRTAADHAPRTSALRGLQLPRCSLHRAHERRAPVPSAQLDRARGPAAATAAIRFPCHGRPLLPPMPSRRPASSRGRLLQSASHFRRTLCALALAKEVDLERLS